MAFLVNVACFTHDLNHLFRSSVDVLRNIIVAADTQVLLKGRTSTGE